MTASPPRPDGRSVPSRPSGDETAQLLTSAEPETRVVPPQGWTGLFHSVSAHFQTGSKKKRTNQYFAQRYGFNTRMRYTEYYIPALRWIPQYKLSKAKGDFLGALTIASMYIPMSLSVAANLGYMPAVNGLYTFVFGLLVYSLLGTSPSMIVGPEVPCSLLAGQAIIKYSSPENESRNAQLIGIVTLSGGIMVFLAGLLRLGFLDHIMSRPFLRGFISSIGIVIVLEQLVPILGLNHIKDPGGSGHSSGTIEKLGFLFRHLTDVHLLTCVVSLGALSLLIMFRSIKHRLKDRYPSVSLFPDRFLIVVIATIATWLFRWHEKGLDIMGDVKLPGGTLPVHVPTDPEDISIARELLGSSLVIALLGFFESSVAAKSIALSSEHNSDKKIELPPSPEVEEEAENQAPALVSANRELVALGVANIVGGLFMTLPVYGGLGRSKVGLQAGATSQMESVFLAILTLLCALYLAPLFFYIPRGVLCALIADVGLSLTHEAPADIQFFLQIQGWSELFLMAVTFVTTVFWDLQMGIMVGVGISVLRVIRYSTRPRIQILGRNQDTGEYEDAEETGPLDEHLIDAEEAAASSSSSGVRRKLVGIEGCLIVKIPGPLFFANTGDLGARLRRLEFYGTGSAHPALPRINSARNVIFEVHGVTRLDGASAQILGEIIQEYRQQSVNVYFCGLRQNVTVSDMAMDEDPIALNSRRKSVWETFNSSGIVSLVGGESHFVKSIDEAIRRIRQHEDGRGTAGPVRRRSGNDVTSEPC